MFLKRIELPLGQQIAVTSKKWRTVAYWKTTSITKRLTEGVHSRVLFFPMQPHPFSAIYKMCHQLGCTFERDPAGKWDIAFAWDAATERGPYDAIDREARGRPAFNTSCLDIRKSAVCRVFSETFGYPLAVDPLVHQGPCLRKSERNATHDGCVVQCPLVQMDREFSYQRLINNYAGNSMVEDIRVPFVNGYVPFVYRKLRPDNDRFSNTNTLATLVSANELLQLHEIEKIKRFCVSMHLDYGELDVLRNRDDGLLYIVDVNPTPWGPPNHLSRQETAHAIRGMAREFQAHMLSPPASVKADVSKCETGA